MKLLSQAIILAATCTAVASPPLVGKWARTVQAKGGPTTRTLEFRGPSTFVQQDAANKKGDIFIVLSKGTYTLSGKWLVVTYKAVKNTNPGPYAKQSLTLPPATQRLEISRLDKNHLVVRYEGRGEPADFSRVKK